ncbi:AI-2E family transporter [Devosia sp. CAU 1758]
MHGNSTSPTFSKRRPKAVESIAAFGIVTLLLYFGAGIFVPLVLATLLAFVLNPLVSWMNRRVGLPDAVAVILAVALAIAIIASFAALAGTQITNLAQELPRYRLIIQDKIGLLQEQFGGLVWLDQINAMVANVQGNLGEDPAPGERQPVPVTISNELGPLSILTSIMGSIVGPIATVAIIVVFLIFLLLGRADLQDRFIRLVSAGRYSLTNLAISDASRRVGRYLIVQLTVNITYGTIFGIGLWLIGVPSAPLWGLLIVLFRYIPFVGALIIAVVPFALAFAVDPGWNMLLMSVALFLVIDLTTANVIEPRLYGSSTGVSPLAILLSAMFWATLWGPVGLILATPMTVCLVVIGRHLPQFQFLETLLGSEPVLAPPERLYQRMLKGDAEDALEMSEEFMEKHGRQSLVRDLMLPSLRLGTSELSDRPDSVPQRRRLIEAFEMVLEVALEPVWSDTAPILIIGGRTEIDEAAARLIALELAELEVSAHVLPPGAIRQEAIGRLDLDNVHTLVLVFVGADLRAQCRYVSRRIRKMAPDVHIAVCILNENGEAESSDTLHVDAVLRDFDSAIERIGTMHMPSTPPNVPQKKPFSGLGRGDDELGQQLDAIAERFNVPAALINLLDDERHRDDEDSYRLTKLVVDQNEPLIIHSASPQNGARDNTYLVTNGIDFYAGVPLSSPEFGEVGALVLLNYEPHEFSEQDIQRLQEEARELVRRFG